MTPRIAFARWRSDVPSGGNRYDDELTGRLRAQGIDVREYPVTGSWPFPSQHDRDRVNEMLATDSTNNEAHWLIDNIVGAAIPQTLLAAAAAGRSVSMLMHYFAADERGLSPTVRARIAADEATAVAAASTVIATSEWTAKEVARRYGRADVIVAVPGVTPADVAPGSLPCGGAPRLLWLARVTPTKDPLTFIAALATLNDLDWRAQLVGPDTIDPEFSSEVRAHIVAAGLDTRVEVLGAHVGGALEMIWAHTDLLVHTALSEAYGMVVTEALSRGIPCIVPVGTGAAEAQHGVGGSFPPGDPGALSRVIRNWLTDPQRQARWRAEATARRGQLPTWAQTAHIVAKGVLTSSSARGPAHAIRAPRSSQ